VKILIIEDEPRAAQRLQNLVTETLAKSGIQADFYEPIDTVSDAIQFLQTAPLLDVLLLDIQLADGLCFEIFDHCSVQVPVIFTTAYDEYAIRAFILHSVDYLLKPIQADHVERAIKKLLALRSVYTSEQTGNHTEARKHDGTAVTAQMPIIHALLETLASTHEQYQGAQFSGYSFDYGSRYKSRFLVATVQGFVSVPAHAVAYCYSEHKVSWLVCTDGKKYAVEYTLEQIVAMLNPYDFFRVNRQYIVRYTTIASVTNGSNGKLTLSLLPVPSDDANERQYGRTHVHVRERIGENVIVPRDKAFSLKAWLDR
jgi:DNA-binding LytR/AlgR family response regulator